MLGNWFFSPFLSFLLFLLSFLAAHGGLGNCLNWGKQSGKWKKDVKKNGQMSWSLGCFSLPFL